MKRKWFLIPVVFLLAMAIGIPLWHWSVLQPGPDPEHTPSATTTVPSVTTPTESTTTTEPTDPEASDPTITPYAPSNLSFTGKVIELDGDSVLMECYDKDKFDTVWVYVAHQGGEYKVGEEYTVTYEDMVMPSLPPRITAVELTQVSSTPAKPTFISKEQAIEIASKYWKIQPGDRDPDTGFVLSIHVMEEPTQENAKYRMALRWLVEVDGQPANYSTLDIINVDAITGEVLPPSEFGVTQ